VQGSDGRTVIATYDSRQDLGYGTNNPKFHHPRALSGNYPYKDFDPYQDEEFTDEESVSSVRSKSVEYFPTDHFAGGGTDSFYFAGGNTKLSDCFWRVDKVLFEIAAFSDSMVSVPQLHKSVGPSSSGYSSAFPYQGGGGSNYKRTGTLRGWSKSPPPLKVALKNDIEKEEGDFAKDDDIYTLIDLAKKDS